MPNRDRMRGMTTSTLWQTENCAAWHAALDAYPSVIRAQQVRGLEELDAWYRTELPLVLAARKPPHVTREELERVTLWKMKRGVWRERNRLLVISNEASTVKRASKDALAAVPDPHRPIALLSDLAGVGPATASAVLASYAPAVYPFFDDLVAVQVSSLGKVAFTPAYYQRYAAALRERATQLHAECKHRAWTAQDVSQALWAASGGKIAQT